MNIAKITILILIVFFSLNSYGNPSEAPPDKKSEATKLIYSDKDLSALDQCLNDVYQKALKNSPNTGRIKLRQSDWLEKRPVESEDLKSTLIEYYQKGIIDLLKYGTKKVSLAEYYLLSFKDKAKVDDYTLFLSLLTLLQEKGLNFKIDTQSTSLPLSVEKLKFIQLNSDNYIVCLSPSEGIYRFTYEFFLLNFKDNKISIKSYYFESPTNFKLETEAKNILIGVFRFDEKNKLLEYTVHPRSNDEGNKCNWKLEISGGKLISEEGQT